MPEAPILEAVDESREHGYLELTFQEYIPPAGQYDSRGDLIELNDDPFREWDESAARETMKVINAKVPKYPGWCVSVDGRNKIALISLRTLMGVDKHYCINLTTHDLCEKTIVEACGQICERYRLPRDRMDIAAFLRARERFSRLLSRIVKVPE